MIRGRSASATIFIHTLIQLALFMTAAGLPARSLFREKVAIGTFLQNWVLKGSLLWVKSPYFTISYENNAYFLGKSFQFLVAFESVVKYSQTRDSK